MFEDIHSERITSADGVLTLWRLSDGVGLYHGYFEYTSDNKVEVVAFASRVQYSKVRMPGEDWLAVPQFAPYKKSRLSLA